jgi:hypothetical protein
MGSLVRKAKKIHRHHGILDLVVRGTRYFISQGICAFFGLPSRKIGVYNGVAVRKDVLLRPKDVHQRYEKALIRQIRETLQPGERVVVVGGGNGVSTTVAAQKVGESGEVTTYEGSRTRSNIAQETCELNKVAERVEVKHAIVSHERRLFSEAEDAAVVDPEDLPTCDVLIMDCEGAELDILRNLSLRPRAIIVETHGFLNSPEREIREILTESGYSVVDRGKEDEEKGVFVLTALDE